MVRQKVPGMVQYCALRSSYPQGEIVRDHVEELEKEMEAFLAHKQDHDVRRRLTKYLGFLS